MSNDSSQPIKYRNIGQQRKKQEFEQLPDEAKQAFLTLEKKRDAFTTRKSQELSDQLRQAKALGSIAQAIQTDPDFRAHIVSYGQQGEQQAKVKQEERPDDPLEAIKWDAKQEVLQELAPLLREIKQGQAAFENKNATEAALAPFRQDEHFDSVMQAMNGAVAHVMRTQGKARADELYQRLDTDPQFFGEFFHTMKGEVLKVKQASVKQEPPRGRKVTDVRPLVHGQGAPPDAPKSKRKRFEEASANVVQANGRVNAEAVGNMLDTVFGDID